MRYLVPLFLCLAGAAAAAGWRLQAGDAPFSQAELEQLPGRSFTFFDDGVSLYGADGAYSYTYSAKNGGGTAWGTYHIANDGSVCVEFVNGFSRCDLYVHNGGRVVLIDETGSRYPVR